MNEYPKIQTVFSRDPGNHNKTLLQGHWAYPEFAYLQDNDWVFTEKVDGTNVRVIFQNNEVHFRGKADKTVLHPALVTRLRERFGPIRDKVAESSDGQAVCFYGEGYGPKIQSGGKYRADNDFVLFDIRVGDSWVSSPAKEAIAGGFNLDLVPTIGHGTLSEMVEMTREGFTSCWGDFRAEGIVARPVVELQGYGGRRIITKIKHKDFARD